VLYHFGRFHAVSIAVTITQGEVES
jgi:hypothetical protein